MWWKGKQKIVAIVKQYLGFDSSDEIQITVIGLQGKNSFHPSSTENKSHDDEIRRNELFPIEL